MRYAAALCFATATAVTAQYDRAAQGPYRTTLEYDGQFTFVRLRWNSGFGRGGFGAAWNHDLPRAEQHLAMIMRELSLVDMRIDGSRILMLDDPELFKYPIAFMWEPGFWNLTDEEATRLFDAEVGPALLKVSKNPDWVRDRGHYFPAPLPDSDKRALKEFLKTF